MRYFKPILLLSLLLCGMAAGLVQFYWNPEPEFQGKTLSDWLYASHYGLGGWSPSRLETAFAITAMGTNSISFLVEGMSSQNRRRNEWKQHIVYWLIKHHLGNHWELLRVEPDALYMIDQRLRALESLQSGSKDVVSVLISIYKRNGKNSHYVPFILGQLRSPDAVPFLIEEASRTNAIDRGQFYRPLGYLHSDAERVIPILTKGLHDPDESARFAAAIALGEFTHEAWSAIPELEEFLKIEKQTQVPFKKLDQQKHRISDIESALEAITEK